MTPTTLDDSCVQSALRHGARALKRVANYVLSAALDRRLQTLGENKEYLGAAEHGRCTDGFRRWDDERQMALFGQP